MKAIVSAFALLAVVPDTRAKVFDMDHLPKDLQQLRNGDSFSLVCKNNHTGVIDRESLDVDAGTVTVEIPGNPPAVHKIRTFSIGVNQGQDRFGAPSFEMYVQVAGWGQIAPEPRRPVSLRRPLGFPSRGRFLVGVCERVLRHRRESPRVVGVLPPLAASE